MQYNGNYWLNFSEIVKHAVAIIVFNLIKFYFESIV